jgi:hypothetical protein
MWRMTFRRNVFRWQPLPRTHPMQDPSCSSIPIICQVSTCFRRGIPIPVRFPSPRGTRDRAKHHISTACLAHRDPTRPPAPRH